MPNNYLQKMHDIPLIVAKFAHPSKTRLQSST